MAETAALLADEVLPDRPMRQWVLSLPFALRFLLATDPEALTHVLGIVYRAICGFVLEKARLTRREGETGAVTLIQSFGSALNLNIHFHVLCLDDAFLTGTDPPVFRRIARLPVESFKPWWNGWRSGSGMRSSGAASSSATARMLISVSILPRTAPSTISSATRSRIASQLGRAPAKAEGASISG